MSESLAIRKPRRRGDRFVAGDRVKERGRPGMDVAKSDSPNFALVSRFRHTSRQGCVISLSVKADKVGRRCTYVNVIWDGASSPSQHAASRLVALT
jgi:hypothetical protein